jgi:hypothetical protein
LSNAVGTDDRSAASRPTVGGGKPSEITHIEAALPREGTAVKR